MISIAGSSYVPEVNGSIVQATAAVHLRQSQQVRGITVEVYLWDPSVDPLEDSNYRYNTPPGTLIGSSLPVTPFDVSLALDTYSPVLSFTVDFEIPVPVIAGVRYYFGVRVEDPLAFGCTYIITSSDTYEAICVRRSRYGWISYGRQDPVALGLVYSCSETLSPTPTLTPTESPTLPPTETLTLTPTETSTPTPTETLTPTETSTLTPTETLTLTPTLTLAPTETPILTATMNPTPPPTVMDRPMCNRYCQDKCNSGTKNDAAKCKVACYQSICKEPLPSCTPSRMVKAQLGPQALKEQPAEDQVVSTPSAPLVPILCAAVGGLATIIIALVVVARRVKARHGGWARKNQVLPLPLTG
mmetsp:Transcript_7913/g.12678  ORF Transcript_7913/g.12678 Transcript_7913/m.12678 type:complete len:358 (+) Transcript_7913:377-1450(+)|eukprot:CAMPEP_0184675432 /NCGR_PEP_ID=MMETSP0308-20130426/87782_1 /TAXON_ID=38269 /ORGANISM="Gloeochaete witrockiana, Strain SAG 46.84" /LENGTH=357 /DNA_ID=CAMNT_0027123133 /DNA_START=361 /DNA_END=1434 /DNA_ORIENTATION=-